MAHALAIWCTLAYLAGLFRTADLCLPDAQPVQVRRWTAGIAAAGFVWIVGFHLWHYASAQYVFINDDALYYTQQLTFSNVLAQGLEATWQALRASIGTDYTYVPNLLLAAPFSLTDRSIQAHGLCGVILTWSLLMHQLRRLALCTADALQVSPTRAILLHAGLVLACCTLPVLHRATSWCQVNLLGLPVFAGVVLLSWRCDFRRPRVWQLAGFFACVLLLVLMRRWFIFLLGSYLLLWALRTAGLYLQRRNFRALGCLTLYGGLCAGVGLALLWPLFAHAIQGNYAVTYSYWKGGGVDFWLKNQGWRAGWGTLIAALAGCLWGLVQRRSRPLRALTAVLFGAEVIAFAAFNTLQSMNAHQETILMPFFLLGIWLLFAWALTLRRKALRAGFCLLLTALLTAQYGLCLTHEAANVLHPLLPYDTLKPPVRQDFASIRAVADFIDQHCSAQEQALVLCNSDRYDKQTFTNVRFPDLTIREKVIQQGHSRPSDGFPGGWFTARYLIVPTVPQTNQPGGTSEKLTSYILQAHPEKFRTVLSVPFDGFDMLILERAEAFTEAELTELNALFAQENESYPLYYSQRIRWYYEQWYYNGQ